MSTEALGTEVKGPSRHLYNRDGNLIGSWRCRPSDPEFPGGWVELPTVVFPRTTVQITQQGEEPLVGDPNVVVLYRGQQEYSRGVVDPEGDRCEYFEIEPDWIRQATRRYDPAVAEYAPSPFARQTHAVVGPELYLFQRMLTRQLENDPQLDPMLVEGAVARILDFVVHAIFQCREQAPTNGSSKATRLHRSIVLDTKAFLGANLAK